MSESRHTVELMSDGTVTLIIYGNLFSMSKDDRDFCAALADLCFEYEASVPLPIPNQQHEEEEKG